jgi:single-strand DNA-binding protein
MKCVNKVILVGNITAKPNLQVTGNGQKVATFGLATNRSWVTKDQDKKTSAEFHKIVAWSKLAEICHNYLEKGQLVYIEGYLKTRSWEDENGNKQFKTEIVARDMIRLQRSSDFSETSETNEDQSYGEDSTAEEAETEETPEAETIEKPTQETAEEVTAESNESEQQPAEDPQEKEEKPQPEAEKTTNPIDLDLGL